MTRSKTTRFGLIRHAATLWNEQKKIQGQQDSALSPGGRNQAAAWGRQLSRFQWQRIVCSDLGRARETVDLINKTLCLPVVIEPRLREQDWGMWSGMTLAEVKATDPRFLRQQIRSGWDFRPPAGESRREVLERCLQGLTAIRDAWPEAPLLVVCHEGVIKCLLYHLLGRRFLPEEPRAVKRLHLHLVEGREKTFYVEQMNCLALAGTDDQQVFL
jgi:broad specificity phosphatase PhoE